MATYRITYAVSHPAGFTHLSRRDLVASDLRTARDAIRGLNPGCKIISTKNLEKAFEARIRRAEGARNH